MSIDSVSEWYCIFEAEGGFSVTADIPPDNMKWEKFDKWDDAYIAGCRYTVNRVNQKRKTTRARHNG